MDKHNNVGRTFTLKGAKYMIIDVSADGKVYMVVDVYGRESLMSVNDVINKGSSLH